jgi:hypothetical protein
MKHNHVRRTTVGLMSITPIAAVLALLAACGDSTGPHVPAGAIQIVSVGSATWSPTSTTTKGFSVPITITNNWDRTIYFVRGCGADVEQNTDGSWRRLPSQTVCALAVGYPPAPIAPGESLTQATFFSTVESSAVTAQHRVVVGLAVKEDEEFRLLPDRFSVSSPFLVTNGS